MESERPREPSRNVPDGSLALHVPRAQGFRPASCLTAREDARPPCAGSAGLPPCIVPNGLRGRSPSMCRERKASALHRA
ncbi:MAG: hypothetical protein FWG50_09590 [Kiritimatiellaeota bacterium]|nr:hypothetical protein [Kiritimatiellota bacterium]